MRIKTRRLIVETMLVGRSLDGRASGSMKECKTKIETVVKTHIIKWWDVNVNPKSEQHKLILEKMWNKWENRSYSWMTANLFYVVNVRTSCWKSCLRMLNIIIWQNVHKEINIFSGVMRFRVWIASDEWKTWLDDWGEIKRKELSSYEMKSELGVDMLLKALKGQTYFPSFKLKFLKIGKGNFFETFLSSSKICAKSNLSSTIHDREMNEISQQMKLETFCSVLNSI